MRNVLVVFGTRPEAIKMCPLINELNTHRSLSTYVCVTGQHRSMLDQVLHIFSVVPDFDLSIMKPGQSLFDITAETLMRMETVLQQVNPDIVLVHGDTTTSFAAALAAFYNQIAVGHVEAGLRTYNLQSPYPEEFNRQVVDKISTLLFAPTETSKLNLLHEGYSEDSIFVTGNTGIDALRTTVKEHFYDDVLDWAKGSRLILMTAHRRENLGKPMHDMFRGIRRIVDEYSDVKVVYPVHLNPIVREIADEELGNSERIKLIEPLDAIAFHNFMAHAYMILTDSGGVQEEAPSLGKPVLVMRDTTERPEGIAAGTLKLVGTDESSIYSECKQMLENPLEYERMSHASNPYGDGHASERIYSALVEYFGEIGL